MMRFLITYNNHKIYKIQSLCSTLLSVMLLLCCQFCPAQNYQAGPYKFTVLAQEGMRVEYSHQQSAGGVLEVTCRFSIVNPLKSPLNIKWTAPLRDITGCWSTNGNEPRFIHPGAKLESNVVSQAPVLALFNDAGMNRLTIALSDAFHRSTLFAGVNEDSSELNCSAQIELWGAEQTKSFEITLMLNNSAVRYEDALKQVSNWWAAMPEYRPAVIPAAAKQPLYSTWYSYHQNFDEQALLGECVEAHKLGYTGIIVDDGWQTLNHSGGYGFTGDWKPERLTHMDDFVKNVHATGMKCLLWYSVPFVGYHAEAFKRFEGKFLYRSDRQSAAILDPRYPEVRRFIVDRYVQALNNWKLDGFKLDFIDSFTNQPGQPPVAGKGADHDSLYDGVDALMVEIIRALTAIKPDILIEFRQSYTGPAMRKYGNMFRAGDCPEAPLTNRVRTTDIKLLAGNTAVHADMLAWNYHDKAEVAALQLLNVIFAVPQLSVRLKEIPPAHRKMIAFYTRYWLNNKAILLDGDFRAYGPELNFPLLTSQQKGKLIAGVYSDQSQPVTLSQRSVDVINAKTTNDVLVRADNVKSYLFEVFDCQGNKISSSKLQLRPGIHQLRVPASGMACLRQL
jgi:alpha-galactosidase